MSRCLLFLETQHFNLKWMYSHAMHIIWSCSIFADIQESIQGDTKGYITLHFRGLDMKNVEPGLLGLGRSDPFFEIAKKNSDHAAGVVRWYVNSDTCLLNNQ